jgi:hypothetical protein
MYIVGKYIIYLYELKKQVYCLYPAISNSKATATDFEKNRVSSKIIVILIVFNGVIYHVHAYTVSGRFFFAVESP